ncbi:hypothetical protein LP52_21900 [Streptomonospora alba]|uniref:Small multi-drug export protein n=1 Tax=Streptomonospora alba TaxID=183763 RepID=A0A0C2JJ43_9ACTN|nr:small multi-drug export protein [Streptomonospora alba]KIH96922.1 hypothetical protein LP52_21900 [Streptomonospora alba]
MSAGQILVAVGVFLGGATPWLEAVVVIPAGIVAGLNPVVALLAGAVGNLVTVGVAAWSGERIRRWWIARRRRRRGESPDTAPVSTGRRARAERIARRWGMPALALLGPLGLGTQLSALVAVGIGASSRAAFAWVGAATVLWSVVAAVAAETGMNIAGIG